MTTQYNREPQTDPLLEPPCYDDVTSNMSWTPPPSYEVVVQEKRKTCMPMNATLYGGVCFIIFFLILYFYWK